MLRMVVGPHEAACHLAAPAVLIRAADESDAGAMAEVFVAAWRQAYPGVVPDEVLAGLDLRKTETWLAGLIANRVQGSTDVAVRDGRVVGFVRYGNDAAGGHVFGLYVHPDTAGHGVGRALLGHAEERLAETGSQRVSLYVFAANERARRLYDRSGYLADGTQRVEPEYQAQEVRLVKVLG